MQTYIKEQLDRRLSINRADCLPHKSTRKKVPGASPPHIHFTSPAMSAPKKHARGNDFATQMEARVKRFRDMETNIRNTLALAENLLQARDNMLLADDAAATAAAAAAKAKPASGAGGAAGGAHGKVITTIDLTNSDSDSDSDSDDEVQMIGQRAVP